MKVTDRTEEEWEDLIEQWHTTDTGMSIKEFLDLNDFEYTKLCFGVRDDNITQEELSAYQRYVADVVTGRISE